MNLLKNMPAQVWPASPAAHSTAGQAGGKKSTILILTTLLIISTGCSIKFNSSETKEVTNDAGVFVTETGGDSWAQKVLIPTTSGKPQSIGGVSVDFFVMDPSDNKAIYLSTRGNGLFYTYDRGKNWRKALGVGRKKINSLSIDKNSKCTIYAAASNQLYKTTDCMRSWKSIYIDNSKKISINAVAVDHYNSNNIYIGTSKGDVIKSSDQGGTWRTIKRFKINIKKFIFSPDDSRIFFVVTGKGVYRTKDGGSQWINLNDSLKDFKNASKYRDMIILETEPGLLYLVSNYGILKTSDYGDSWERINLISAIGGNNINAIAVNPKNISQIYLTTNTTFYRTSDGGSTWTPKKLTTTGMGWKLLIDPKDPKILYMGVKKVVKKK